MLLFYVLLCNVYMVCPQSLGQLTKTNMSYYITIVSLLLLLLPLPYSILYSFTEDVTPEELSKILASFDPTIASLERKIASSGPVVNVSAKAKKAAAAMGKGTSILMICTHCPINMVLIMYFCNPSFFAAVLQNLPSLDNAFSFIYFYFFHCCFLLVVFIIDSAGIEEQKWQRRERQDELAVLQDVKNMRNVG